MDWNNFDFEDLQVQDIISDFDPYGKTKLKTNFESAVLKLDSKSNEELSQLLVNLLKTQNEIESVPKSDTHGGKKIQLFSEFLSKFIFEINDRLNRTKFSKNS